MVCVQARELWSEEERVHLRPGHFWLALLGDADGKGSPIIAGPFKEKKHMVAAAKGRERLEG